MTAPPYSGLTAVLWTDADCHGPSSVVFGYRVLAGCQIFDLYNFLDYGITVA